jgi:hypothetical protein
MATVAFDTLKLARGLREKAGFTAEQAEGAAAAIAESVTETLVTRDYLDHRISAVDARIADARADILKWMVATIGVQTLAILGGIIVIVRFIQP